MLDGELEKLTPSGVLRSFLQQQRGESFPGLENYVAYIKRSLEVFVTMLEEEDSLNYELTSTILYEELPTELVLQEGYVRGVIGYIKNNYRTNEVHTNIVHQCIEFLQRFVEENLNIEDEAVRFLVNMCNKEILSGFTDINEES